MRELYTKNGEEIREVNGVSTERGAGHDHGSTKGVEDDCGYSTGDGEVHVIAKNEIHSEVDGEHTTLTVDDSDVDNATAGEKSKYLPQIG